MPRSGEIGCGGHLYVECYLTVRAIGSRIWGIFCCINRHIGDLRNWLANAVEECIYIRLNPSAAQFDNRYYAPAGKTSRPVVRSTKIWDTPRFPALSNLGAGCPMTNLKIGMDAKSLRHMGVRMNSNVCTSSDVRRSLHNSLCVRRYSLSDNIKAFPSSCF